MEERAEDQGNRYIVNLTKIRNSKKKKKRKRDKINKIKTLKTKQLQKKAKLTSQ